MDNMFFISWDIFTTCIEGMKSLSDGIHDGWLIHGETDIENKAYFSKTKHMEVNNGEDDEILTFEYHIVYNASYAVPELCFNVFKTDGTLIALEDCLKFLNLDDDIIHTTLTQMDHPILQRPFLTLHPCKTAELIKMSFKTSKNVVVSWLSVIGPPVQLYLPNEYAALTF